MAVRPSDNRWAALVIIPLLFALGAGIFAYVAWRETSFVRRDVAQLRRETSETREATALLNREIQALGTEVKLYFVRETPTAIQLAPEKRRILSADLPSGVIMELIKGPAPGSPLRPTLPPGTTLNGMRIRDSVAYVDLGGSITHLNLGSEERDRVRERAHRRLVRDDGYGAAPAGASMRCPSKIGRQPWQKPRWDARER
jgi:hypothetical protein